MSFLLNSQTFTSKSVESIRSLINAKAHPEYHHSMSGQGPSPTDWRWSHPNSYPTYVIPLSVFVQSTTLMCIEPTKDFRIKWVLQDEFLDSMLNTKYFCG